MSIKIIVGWVERSETQHLDGISSETQHLDGISSETQH